jgi:aminoglycoside phosphotransferase (APT) family kinase protein
MHRLSIEQPNGARQSVVLRRWVGPGLERAQASVERESTTLVGLSQTDVPSPRLLANSLGDRTNGHPAVLMTQVSGHVHLEPHDPEDWMRQMAAMLSRIHNVDIDVEMAPAGQSTIQEAPGWSRRPWLWRAAIELLQGSAPQNRTFIHGDFQHFNVLWSRERLEGVVDWTEAGRGEPDRDVGHCRLNLAVLYSAQMAERFLAAYESEAGRRVDPWWDVYELCAYHEAWRSFIPVQVAGHTDVDVDGMHDRVEKLLDSAIERAL